MFEIRVIRVVDNFKIGYTSKGVVVINEKLNYENHAHFKNIKGAEIALRHIKTKTQPRNRFFKKALLRLLGQEGFDNLKRVKVKTKYKNRKAFK